MLHPDTVIRHINDTVGVGVFATRRIPRGTVTWVRDPLDMLIPAALIPELHVLQQAILSRYSWREGDKAILCWDHGRYVNHSCEANCLGMDPQFEVALRDIEEGEQLTDDYRSLGVFEDPFHCLCGAPGCAGFVQASDIPALRATWAARYTIAVQSFHAVAQPLLTFVIAPPPAPTNPGVGRAETA